MANQPHVADLQETQIVRPHPRTIGWISTTALAMGGSNQSLFIMGAVLSNQGSAAIPLLICGLLLSWAAAPGWTELILMWPNRVGGIAATCAEAFRPYSPVLANLTGVCYWWGWIPTCGLTAILSATAIHEWYVPGIPIARLATLLIVVFMAVNLCGVRWAARLAVPIATASATLAFLSGLIPLLSGHVDMKLATSYSLVQPFPGIFGGLTSAMAGLYLIGFAAPAFEAAACHVGETIDPQRNVPRAMFASGAMATLYFALLPVIWLGVLGPHPLAGNLQESLDPTFAPLVGTMAHTAAIWFMMFNMFHGTLQPLAGAARTLMQLSEDGLLPRILSWRSRTDAPWIATLLTAGVAIAFLTTGDPPSIIAAANLTYLIGICLPNVAVWLLRRDAPQMDRPFRAPRGTIMLGMVAAGVWAISTILGFEKYGMPTVLTGLALAYSGVIFYVIRRWRDRRQAGLPGFARSLHVTLTGAMLIVLILDGAGYLLAVKNVSGAEKPLITGLEDIFVAVALLTISVGLVLPGVIAHAAGEVARAADRLASGTLADLSQAMQALGAGNLAAAHARVDVVPITVHMGDELGAMAASFNTMQDEIARAAAALDVARDDLRQAHDDLTQSHAALQASEERFRSLSEHATDLVQVLDRTGTIVYASPSHNRILGYPAATLESQSIHMFIHADDAQLIDDMLAFSSQRTDGVFQSEYRVRHANGSWRTLEILANNRLADPAIGGIIVNARDVTERQRAEEARRQLFVEQAARVEAQANQRRLAFLSSVSDILGSSLDYTVTLPQLAQVAVSHFFDGCVIDVINSETTLRRVAVAPADPSSSHAVSASLMALPLSLTQVATMSDALSPLSLSSLMPSSGSSTVADAAAVVDDTAATSPTVLPLPLRARGRILGMMYLHCDDPLRWLNAVDRNLAQELAQRAAQALDNALLYREAQDAMLAHSQARQRTQEALTALIAMAEVFVLIPGEGSTSAGSGDRSPDSLRIVAKRIGELTRSVLGCDRVAVLSTEKDERYGRVLGIVGLSSEEEAVLGQHMPAWVEQYAAADPRQAMRLAAGHVVVMNLADAPFTELPNPFQTSAILIAPMLVGPRLAGMVVVDHGTREQRAGEQSFSAEELALAGAIGKLAALIIEREKLLAEKSVAQARELALVESNRRMDEFLSIASHEIRTPLTSISGYVQLAALQVKTTTAPNESGPDPGHGTADLPLAIRPAVSLATLLERTDRQVDRLHRLVEELLDVSRIQAGHLRLTLNPINLTQILRDCVEEQRQAWPGRTIGFVEEQGSDVIVLGDADRLAQVITNYLTNALKYSPSDKPVILSLVNNNDTATVRVTDEGPGLTGDQQKIVWERFQRIKGVEVRSGSGHAGGGLGLGLYISKTIIERHQGIVGVNSTLGLGSTFWFTLPLYSDASAQSVQSRIAKDWVTDDRG